MKNGKDYCQIDGTFGYEWFDYYKRALSCMEGEFYQQALADLKKAEKQRFEDKRMAKTFGMHLMDYFPHREKGLIHYVQGNDQAAKSELELSIRQHPSEKAYIYLDKVRKRIMEQRKDEISIPRVIVEDDIWTKDDPVILSGTAEDKQYVSKILMTGDRTFKPVFIDHSKQQVRFEESLALDQGTHEIDIVARNLMGGTGSRRVVIHVDRSGPVISIEKFEPGVGLRGHVYDESGEISLFADGKKAYLPKGKDAAFFLPVKPGKTSVSLSARDKLGNETHAQIRFEMMAQSDSPTRAGIRNFGNPVYPLLAQNISDIATDAVFARSKPEAPQIILDEVPVSKGFKESVSVRGKIIGKKDVREVRINDMLVHSHPGRIIFFNHAVRLDKGENRIIIRAADASGSETVKEMIITRQIPELLKPAYRCIFKAHSFEINALDNTEGDSEGVLFQHLFLGSLIGRNRFQIKMEEKLREVLGRYDLNRMNAAVPGRKVFFSLLGRVYKTRNGIEIIAEIVDIRTSEILKTDGERAGLDVFGESDARSVLETVSERLSEKFHRAFPLVKGRIIQKKGGAFFGATMEHGPVRTMWPLVVGSDTQFIGDAAIDEKQKDGICRIRLLNDDGSRPVMGDWVITQ